MVLSHEVGSMERMPPVLAWTLVLLFLGLSFNAYACLVPLFTASAGPMEAGCPAPEEQPTRQFCDAFTTLGVQGASESPLQKDAPFTVPYGLTASLPAAPLPALDSTPCDRPLACHARDCLLKTTVLRL